MQFSQKEYELETSRIKKFSMKGSSNSIKANLESIDHGSGWFVFLNSTDGNDIKVR